MDTLIILIFIAGYLLIATEHIIKVNKTAIALLTGTLCWAIYAFSNSGSSEVSNHLIEHLSEISGILFFLIGAMTIVELIDAHDGFEIITGQISTTNKRKLLWILSFLAFFLSAILDNLTTTIVLITLLRKLITEKKDRLLFASIIIIAANSGGAFSPIGDVTTTMLWIGNQITTSHVIIQLFIPSLVSLMVPLLIATFTIHGNIPGNKSGHYGGTVKTTKAEQKTIFGLGIGVFLFVPVFKVITNLPPFMGILMGLGLLWFVTELMHSNKDSHTRHQFSVSVALQRMDMPSVLFFLGILVAVAVLQTAGHLSHLATFMDQHIGNLYLIGTCMGLLSAIIDNVPMVAAAMGMYPLAQYPTDHYLWELLAYCAGTGGSILVIGSAAGVAAMGLEKIEFFWYVRKISWMAILGYFAGILTYLAQRALW